MKLEYAPGAMALGTEEPNPRTFDIDRMATAEILRRINEEDRTVAVAVGAVLTDISRVVEAIFERLAAGGRLFYTGAGTSGRLGVLDAVECAPTFGVDSGLVRGILAGGYEACHRSIESAEDDPAQGAEDLRAAGVSARDAVIGIAASGGTPYTIGAVRYAGSQGALTVGISCNRNTPLSREVQIAVEVDTGAEVVAGSTRLKAGTAQKMILNMISTAVMIRLGHVYGNLMVNVHLKNRKLRHRAAGIVSRIAGVPAEAAAEALSAAQDVKVAVIMLKQSCSAGEARTLLQQAGSLRSALEMEKPT